MSSNEHHKPPKPLRAPALPRPRHKQSHTIKMSGLLHTAFGKHWRVQPSGYPGLQMQKFWVSPATRPERDCAPPRSSNFAASCFQSPSLTQARSLCAGLPCRECAERTAAVMQRLKKSTKKGALDCTSNSRGQRVRRSSGGLRAEAPQALIGGEVYALAVNRLACSSCSGTRARPPWRALHALSWQLAPLFPTLDESRHAFPPPPPRRLCGSTVVEVGNVRVHTFQIGDSRPA